MKWAHHPNLRKRPRTPAKGRGSVQRAIKRAFAATSASALTSTQIYDWAHVRRRLDRRPRPVMKWNPHRNLRLRPAKPALGRGRLQVQVRRAFLVGDAPVISASAIYDWCYAKRRLMHGKPLTTRDRYSVWRVLIALGAEPVGRIGPRHATLWRLRDTSENEAK
jgi:hypothetical protein